MSRQALEKKDFTFVAGLNTEAGYLTFPANAWLDGDNLIPNIDGSIQRRTKLDFEASYQLGSSFSTTIKETYAFSNHLWTNVGGLGSTTFIVVQRGNIIRFYATPASSITPNEKSFTIDLTTYKVASSPNVFGTSKIDVAVGNGKLVIVSEDTEPILVEYVEASDTITVTQITLQIRDLQGISDGSTINVPISTISDSHRYNLYNQGWDSTKVAAYQVSSGNYPSNAQIWTAAKDASDDFSPTLLDKQDFGTTPAPKGRYVLDLFNRDRSTASGVANITVETEDYRPKTAAFFAGRIWYSGIRSSTIGSWVTFSQIVESNDKYGYLYQQGDPTSEFSSDLLATDGGVIPIPEAGGIIKLLPVQESLIVFAENGIWQILGDAGGFKATGYQVKKISAFGCVSHASIVEAENTAMYWSTAGIFALKRDPVSGDFSLVPMSFGKVQTLYNDIANFGKKYSAGFYSDEEKKVYWMYQDVATESLVDRFKKDKMLVFDLRLSAFYTFTIAAGDPFVVSGILALNQGDQDTTFSILSGTDSVLSTADTVEATITLTASSPRIPKFLTLTPATTSPSETEWCLVFSDFETTAVSPTKFMDWYSFDSVGLETTTLPFLLTGYQILEDGMHQFQAPYIMVYAHRTETGFVLSGDELDSINKSSCLLQAHWEWTNSAAASRWNTEKEAYRHRRMYVPVDEDDTYDDGFPLVVTKNKIRGKGHALSLKFSCSSGKDMHLAGWAIMYAKNTNV